jgi:DNA-binding transcriptional regulator YdaS (Cro superfamily)
LTWLKALVTFGPVKRKTRKDPALEHAIDAAGGPTELARRISQKFPKYKLTAQAVSGWRRCPPRRVVQVEQVTDGVVPRHRLRPDIYPQ